MSNQQIVGIVLAVLGALLLLKWLSIPYLATIIAVALIIVGILILMKKFQGAPWMGWTAIVLGALVVLSDLPFMQSLGNTVASLLTTAVAVILIVVGVMKYLGKM